MNINPTNPAKITLSCSFLMLLIAFLPNLCTAQNIQNAPTVSTVDCSLARQKKVAEPVPEWKGSRLFDAIFREDIIAVRKLLKEKANPNERDNYGNTPLLYAVASKIGEANRKPIEKVRVRLENEKKAQLIITRELLAHGADANAKNSDGETPLIRTILFGFRENAIKLMTLLIQYKADVNVADNEGNTALMEATEKGYTEAVKFLIANGANPNLKNCEEKTAFIIAESLNNPNMLKVLQSAKQH